MANTRMMAQKGRNPTKKLQETLQRIAQRLFNKKVWKKVWKIVWISGLVGLIAVFGAFLYVLKDLPSPDKLNERQVAESTKILDRSGQTVLYEIHGEEKRTRVSLSEIAKPLQQATLAAEDKNFYKHFGFDAKGILRAVFKNSTGGSLQGGSTITQQLVKNSILTSERTFIRKIKELILAVEVEISFSKDEILEMYLNQIPYGSNAYGTEAAARTFFGKSAKELTLAESATLAAMPKAPTFYSPYGTNTDRLKERRNWILDRMAEDQAISQEEADAAKAEEIKVVERRTGIIAGHFVDLVRQELVDRFGERMSEQGGLKVTTTLDLVKQEIAERTVRDGVSRNERGGYRASNAALTAIDPKTGEVLAMQGSVDYFNKEKDGNVNVAVRERQPGSSFKPIVYAAAFKKGYTPNTILFDVEIDFGGGYRPRNYSLNQNGPLPMGNALARSLNVPAVEALYLVGVDRAITFAHEMGITTLQDPARYGLALVLGGGEVKLVDMVSVYGVFANEGMRQPYVTILTVEDPSGKILLDNRNRQGQRVLEEQTARLMNGVLSDDGARAPTFGSRSYLTIPGRPSAAKSGTTNDFRDAWTIGYVPSLAAGVWVGNNDNAEMSRGADGSKVAAPIWQAFMKEALANVPAESFTRPAPERTGKPILDGQMAEEEEVRLCKPSLKRATDRCPASQIEVKKFRKLHSILYYVDKDNPRGPFPSNPGADPQFGRWENAVKQWAEQKQIALEDPPTEFDDTHDEVDAPHVTVLSPKQNEKISGTALDLSLSGSAEHGLKKVDVFIDGIPFASGTKLPALMRVTLPGVKSGFHTLLIRATDMIDNVGEASVSVNLRILTPMSISIVSIADGTKFKESSFPIPFEVVLSGEVGAKTIGLKVVDAAGGTIFSKTITASVGVTSYTRDVPALDPGTYTARATVTDVNGAVSTAEEVSFTVKP